MCSAVYWKAVSKEGEVGDVSSLKGEPLTVESEWVFRCQAASASTVLLLLAFPSQHTGVEW